MVRMLRTTLLLSGLLAIAACADANTAPDASPLKESSAAASHRTYPGGRGNPSAQTAALIRCEEHPTWTGSAVIGPRGGTLMVGSSRVVVPPGALDKKVFITATMPAGEFVTIRFEFQPHGLVFRKPAGLILNASGCDIPSWATPDIVYLSETGEVLEYIDAYYSNYWHTVAAPIWHFSGYAIAW